MAPCLLADMAALFSDHVSQCAIHSSLALGEVFTAVFLGGANCSTLSHVSHVVGDKHVVDDLVGCAQNWACQVWRGSLLDMQHAGDAACPRQPPDKPSTTHVHVWCTCTHTCVCDMPCSLGQQSYLGGATFLSNRPR